MFAALHVPDFPAAAILRTRRDLDAAPCAVLAEGATEETRGGLPLVAINRAARFAGLAAGWPLNRARVRCPDLRVLPRDPQAESALSAELIALADSLTPDFELSAADAVLLDLAGFPKTAPPSPTLSGVELWQALADTPDLAMLAAHHAATCGRRITPAELTAVPLAALHTLVTPESSKTLELLHLWGLATLGEFMALPRQALAERLGPEAGHWHDLLHGKTRRLLRLHRPPESMRQRVELNHTIDSIDSLIFHLKRLLHTLAGRLAARQVAAAGLELRLLLESGGLVGRSLQLPEPQVGEAGMLAPLQSWLETLRLEAAVVGLELDAQTTFAISAQREWFGRQLPQPQRWVETLAKLAGWLGAERVGIPVPAASHAPDAFTMRPANTPPPVPEPSRAPCWPLPLHRYRPPCPVAVAHESRGVHPHPLALLTGPHPGRIAEVRGPYPSSGSWWEPAEFWQRLEWDIQAADRRLLRLALLPPDRWQLEGVYR